MLGKVPRRYTRQWQGKVGEGCPRQAAQGNGEPVPPTILPNWACKSMVSQIKSTGIQGHKGVR